MKNLFFILLAITLLSCDAVSSTTDENSTEECVKTETAYITNVEGEKETEAGKSLDLTLSFPVMNGCGQFNQFKESVSGKTATIAVEAIYEGCICTMDIPTRTATYHFKASAAGTYTLRFKSSATAYILKTITVK